MPAQKAKSPVMSELVEKYVQIGGEVRGDSVRAAFTQLVGLSTFIEAWPSRSSYEP